ncbi:hypothetical protein BJX65DRAFT_261368 [Aspergillus insuetus]
MPLARSNPSAKICCSSARLPEEELETCISARRTRNPSMVITVGCGGECAGSTAFGVCLLASALTTNATATSFVTNIIKIMYPVAVSVDSLIFMSLPGVSHGKAHEAQTHHPISIPCTACVEPWSCQRH